MAHRASLLIFALSVFGLAASATAQDLETLDPAGYSGGYSTNVSGPVGSEILYPYDSPEPWMHGYFQRMPFYGGFKAFRPYNYKHVLSQSQTASGWGMSPKMPYSQQFWHRYHQQAQLMPMVAQPAPANHFVQQPQIVPAQPTQSAQYPAVNAGYSR